MKLVTSFLLLLNLDIPETLDSLLFLLFLRLLDLGYTQGEERKWQELEGVFGTGAVGDGGKKGILLASLFIGRRLEGTDCAFDWARLSDTVYNWEAAESHTLEHVLALLLKDTSALLEILALEKVCDSKCLGFRWSRSDGLLLLLLLLHLLLLHLLCAHLLLHLVLAHGLSLELLDILRNAHAGLLGLDGQLTLHGLNLLGSGLLTGLESGRHQNGLTLLLTGLAWLAGRALLLRW